MPTAIRSSATAALPIQPAGAHRHAWRRCSGMVNLRGGVSVGRARTACTVSRRPSRRARHSSQPATWSATRACVAESSSWSRYAESSSSVGSAGIRGSLGMGILSRGKKIWVLLQVLLDLGAGAGDLRLDSTERHGKHGSDLVVGHAVYIAQDDGDAHVVV